MFGRRRKPIARGSSVYIFSATREVAADFLHMTNSSAIYHQPWVYPATDARRFKSYINRVTNGRAYGYFIGLNEDDCLVGVVNINDVMMGGFRSGSLGYYADMNMAGNGYMTEGLALVMDQAFTTLDLNRLEANIQPANAASIAVVRKLGFRKEGFSPKFLKIDGIWRDHERWAILGEEWLAAAGLR
ncbi:MAG: GNAT family N-acetyltransferase [Rhodospirillaceae bacterium]